MDSSEINSNDVKPSKEHNVANSHSEHLPNGLANGLNAKSDSHHKHKHKSKDKDRDKHNDKHRNKEKDRDRDRHSHSHSSSKDKSKDSGEHKKDKDERRDKEHRSKDKDKDKDHHRDKDHHNRDKDKEHSSKSKETNEKDKNSKDKSKEHRDKYKDHKSSSKDKEHKSSSNSKHSENDKHSSSHRDKEKHHSSSSSKHSNSKDGKSSHVSGTSSSSDKDKYKHSKHSSSDKTSSSKHSSSEKKSGDKEKPSSYDVKDDIRKYKENSEKPYTVNEIAVKEEPLEDSEDSSFYQNQSTALVEDKPNLNIVSGGANASSSTIKQENLSDENTSFENSFNQKKSIKNEYDDEEEDDDAADDTYDASEDEENSKVKTEIKQEEDSDDDIPLNQRSVTNTSKRRISQDEDDSDDDVPLSARKPQIKKPKTNNQQKRKAIYSDDEENESDYDKPKKKAKIKAPKEEMKSTEQTPTKKKKVKEEEEQEVWKWWEEEKKEDGVKWKFLEHKGPMFAPPYERLPSNIRMMYDGKEMTLSESAEEVATFYARMIEHDYTTKEAFNKNFLKDWRKYMTPKEKEIITDLKKCDFRKMHAYFIKKSEERKAMSKDEKKKIKEANEEIIKEYGFCFVDGHKEKIGNFKIEPPGLFRGRGEHPKMGMLKKRVVPEDVIINCSKDAKVPDPPKGHKWKEVRHDNTVTWLASWVENVQGQVKYVMLNPSSKLKGEKDWQKYEIARKLAKTVDKIRNEYREDWKSKEMRIRQRAVALYFIDRLALRAGNEKDEDQADTVGCCSLRVEHIQLFEEKDGKNYVVVFDFLGKDSIRYYNELPVEKRVFKNLQLFMERKRGGDDLFDRLNTAVLNKHLNELMEGLTAKVFRTFNASYTLQNQLDELTDPNASVPEKILQYNRANRAVAILCNHQRSIPKSHEKSMGNLKQKIDTKKEQIEIANRQYKDAKREVKDGSTHSKMVLDKKKKALERLKEQLLKLEVQETDKEENKTIALGTSKLNYLDPRISVAWCKKHGVPIEKIYNKTQRMKFRWAIDMAGPEYVF